MDPYTEMRDVWGDYNSRQEFEHQLIDRKTTWLLTTQALLFAAYGVTFDATAADVDDGWFRTVIAWAGIAIAVIIFVGVGALVRSKRRSWKDYRAFFEGHGAPQLPGPLRGGPLQWGVLTSNTWIALGPDLLLPVVFIVAWFLVLAR